MASRLVSVRMASQLNRVRMARWLVRVRMASRLVRVRMASRLASVRMLLRRDGGHLLSHHLGHLQRRQMVHGRPHHVVHNAVGLLLRGKGRARWVDCSGNRRFVPKLTAESSEMPRGLVRAGRQRTAEATCSGRCSPLGMAKSANISGSARAAAAASKSRRREG